MWDHGSEKEAPRSFQAETPTHKQDNSRADPQFQFYVENRLLRHPLVSPALSYLGGLPPLFFVAGDGEVLRDEIVYT
jgi:acetyl esterase/lipase